MFIMERSHAGIAPHHIGGRNRPRKILRSRFAEISNFTAGRDDLRRIAGKIQLGRADQRVGACVRQSEHDAAVGVLEHVRAAMIEQLRHHDVRAFDKAQPPARRQPGTETRGQRFFDPRARGV